MYYSNRSMGITNESSPAHNPYGAPTAFMTGGWMNLKRVCHFEMSQAAAALKSPQGQLGLAVIWTRHVQQVLKARPLIAISTMAIAAKNPVIANGYKLAPTFLFWEAWFHADVNARVLSSLSDILSTARWEIWCVRFCLALLHYKTSGYHNNLYQQEGQQSMTLLCITHVRLDNLFGSQGHNLTLSSRLTSLQSYTSFMFTGKGFLTI